MTNARCTLHPMSDMRVVLRTLLQATAVVGLALGLWGQQGSPARNVGVVLLMLAVFAGVPWWLTSMIRRRIHKA